MPKGFLFIGDPHLASRTPGRRRDDFAAAVLANLGQAADIAVKHDLLPVVLGDLFHRNDENHLPTLSRLVGVLSRFPQTPWVVEGNHDKGETRLTDRDALLLLAQTGVVRIASTVGPVDHAVVENAGRRAQLFAAPYGCAIPGSLPVIDGTDNVLVTHHDLAFAGAYPGAAPIPAVAGCPMLVNGHMHKTLPSVTMGATRAHNPGNIARLSVDVRDHVEAVWSWLPGCGHYELARHALEFDVDVFDMAGLQVPATDGSAAVAPLLAKSQFAGLYASAGALDTVRSEDAGLLLEDLEAGMEAANASEGTRALLRHLASLVAEAPQPEKTG